MILLHIAWRHGPHTPFFIRASSITSVARDCGPGHASIRSAGQTLEVEETPEEVMAAIAQAEGKDPARTEAMNTSSRLVQEANKKASKFQSVAFYLRENLKSALSALHELRGGQIGAAELVKKLETADEAVKKTEGVL